jgi:hypothetical protein
MQYPLTEKIGDPDLFVGREKEFFRFNKWLANIPKRLSKSRVIMARRKTGKTVFVQRIFNQIWSANGMVIPFYFEFGEHKIWYPDLAIDYYSTFASQYISFLERNEKWVSKLLTLEQIKQYGLNNSIEEFVDDVDFFIQNKEVNGSHDLMWKRACTAPHRFAEQYKLRSLVILDEFQYISTFVYRDEKCEGKFDETMPGSFHSLSESKIAPMLITGSYAGWLLQIIHEYLEAGRVKEIPMSPYLTSDEGLEAVYKYADFYQEPITNKTAVLINELCMSDAFFIASVIESEFENKKLNTEEGVIQTVNYEISHQKAEMSLTWGEYLDKTLEQVNDRHAKSILLLMNKENKRYWTPQELKDTLNIDMEVNEIKRKLEALVASDVIEKGISDIQFRGLQDGTLNLVLRSRFEEEIKNFVPNLKKEFREQIEKLKFETRQLRGKLNSVSGKMAEHLLATTFRSKKRFALSEMFEHVVDKTPLNLTLVNERFHIQRQDGKLMEFDIMAESSDERVVLVEVKKTQAKIGLKIVEDFQEKVIVFGNSSDKTILSAFLSLGGFTVDAKEFCLKHGIAMADKFEDYGF